MNQTILEKLLLYLPYIAFGAVLLGVFFVILLIIFLSSLSRRSARRKALSRAPSVLAEENQKQSVWLRIGGFFNRLKMRWGWLGQDEISRSFKRTQEIFKTYLGGRSPQYELPWFLLLGSESSGKSTLLKDVDLELPIGNPEYEVEGDDAKLNWSFFDQGVFLDVKGRLFIEKASLESDEQNWEYILRLLNHYRSKRPIDGIVLTVPVDEFIGDTKLSFEEIEARARVIAAKLWKVQDFLSMHVPVYVMVTKIDLLPGFNSFVANIPELNQQDVFGWSSPYALDAQYSPSWVDEIFDYVHQSLNKLRDSIFCHTKESKDKDGVFIFPIELANLKEPLSFYLNTLFKQNPYREAYFLRGVYFCGKAEVTDIAVEDLFELEDKPRLGDLLEDEGLPSVLQDPLKDKIKTQVIFLRDLFEKKIFPEASLARPVYKIIASTNRLLNFSKAVTATIAVIWFMGLFLANESLKKSAQDVLPTLNEIQQALVDIDKRGGVQETPEFIYYVKEEAQIILQKFTVNQTGSIFSMFIPASWFSSIDKNIIKAYTVAYEKVILPSLHAALTEKIDSVVSLEKIPHATRSLKQGYLNPTLSPEFANLRDYVQQVKELEYYTDIYNRLDQLHDIHQFGALIKYLFNTTLQNDFYLNDDYYFEALARVLDRDIELQPHKVAAGEKLGSLFRVFLEQTFNVKQNFPLLLEFQKSITKFHNAKVLQNIYAYELRQTAENALAVADMLTQGALAWLNQTEFSPSGAYKQMMDNIESSMLLGHDLAQEISKIANREFIDFKFSLAKYQSSLTGPFFDSYEGRLLAKPSPGLIEFIDTVSAYLKEPFMEVTEKGNLVFQVPPGKVLFWDDNILKKAVETVDAYNQFVKQRIVVIPEKLRNILRLIAQNNLRELLIKMIADSQTFQDQPDGMLSFGAQEMLHSQIGNLVAVTPYFTKILEIFDKGQFLAKNAKLREFFITQTYQTLEKVQNLLDTDNLYSIDEVSIRQWQGEPNLAFLAFDVYNTNDLKTYLTAQRNRITYLGKELAEPILLLLSLGHLEDMPLDLPLVPRWSRIVSALNEYEKKSPGNSVKALEDFVIQDLNQFTLENCADKEKNAFEFEGTGDYFLEVRNKIFNAVVRRCKRVIGQNSLQRYDELSSFFNQNLAGRFPFTKENIHGGLEADPVDVRTFFELFSTLTPTEISTLLKSTKQDQNRVAVADFIKQVQSIQKLALAAVEEVEEGENPPELKLKVTFRTDRAREIGGDKIIDWTMNIGGRHIDFRSKKPELPWQTGMPISVGFRWANDGVVEPASDITQSSLSVSGQSALFNYNGRWALIRLLRDHMIREAKMPEPRPLLLEFKIPTRFKAQGTEDEKSQPLAQKTCLSQVYLRVAIQAVEKPQKAGQKPTVKNLILPRFPWHAPDFGG